MAGGMSGLGGVLGTRGVSGTGGVMGGISGPVGIEFLIELKLNGEEMSKAITPRWSAFLMLYR